MHNGLMTFLAASDPVSHVTDHPLIGFYISNVTVMLIITALLTAWIMTKAAKGIDPGSGRTVEDLRARGILANFVEAICLFLRDEVFKPILKDDTDRFMPILWTFFWFILVANFLGLVPLVDLTGGLLGLNGGHGIWGTATQSIWVTSALAFIAFLLINGVALMRDPVGYFAHMTGGLKFSVPMLPVIAILFVVEFAGVFVKPVALAIRLFANMTGGHIMLAVLFSFLPGLVRGLGTGIGLPMNIIPLGGAVAIYMLEVLVAFLQAFIFTFLTGMFLGQLIAHGDHDHDEHHAEAH